MPFCFFAHFLQFLLFLLFFRYSAATIKATTIFLVTLTQLLTIRLARTINCSLEFLSPQSKILTAKVGYA